MARVAVTPAAAVVGDWVTGDDRQCHARTAGSGSIPCATGMGGDVPC